MARLLSSQRFRRGSIRWHGTPRGMSENQMPCSAGDSRPMRGRGKRRFSSGASENKIDERRRAELIGLPPL